VSEVISFRLSKDNPREAQALDMLRAWSIEGYSVRQIITEALLKLTDINAEITADTLSELKMTLEQVSQLLEQLGNRNSTQTSKQGTRQDNSELTDSFINSVKKSAKVGVKLID
jgi:hypothetical protein